MDKLANLQVLDLSGNRLIGAIPEGLGNLQHLDAVYLSENRLDSGCIPASWRDLRNHDLDDIDLPFCDVALSALVVSPGELTPRFDPGVSEYTAEVEDGQVTITPATSYGGAFQLLDSEGESVTDADGALGGHQIAVGSGDTTIEIRVLSPDGGDRHTYTVRVVWAGEPRVPAIRNHAGRLVAGGVVGYAHGHPGRPYITGSYDLRHIQSSAPDKADSNWTMLDVRSAEAHREGTARRHWVRRAAAGGDQPGVSPWSATVSGTPTEGECSTEGAVSDAANNPGLVADCEVLLAARDTLAGTASLNWSPDTPITAWDGVTVGGTPQRVTGLALVQEQLSGSIPPELGSLPNLQSLLLSGNQLTGCIPQGLATVGIIVYNGLLWM